MEDTGELDDSRNEIYRECDLDAKYRNPRRGARVRIKNRMRSQFVCTGMFHNGLLLLTFIGYRLPTSLQDSIAKSPSNFVVN